MLLLFGLFLYSRSMLGLLPFHSTVSIVLATLMKLLCYHWCSDDSTRESLEEYSRSLRTCSPRYLIIQYLNNPQKSIRKCCFFFCLFFTAEACWACSPSTALGCIDSIVQQKPEDLLSSIPDYYWIFGPQIIQNPIFKFLAFF